MLRFKLLKNYGHQELRNVHKVVNIIGAIRKLPLLLTVDELSKYFKPVVVSNTGNPISKSCLSKKSAPEKV